MRDRLLALGAKLAALWKRMRARAAEPENAPEKREAERRGAHPVRWLLIRAAAALLLLFVGSLPFFVRAGQVWFILAAFILATGDTALRIWDDLMAGHYGSRHLLMLLVGILALALGRYADAAAVMLVFQAGELMNGAVEEKALGLLESPAEAGPEHVTLFLGGIPHSTETRWLKGGEELLLPVGARAAVDCVVLEGESVVEAAPAAGGKRRTVATRGTYLYAGSRNLERELRVRAAASPEDSLPARARRYRTGSGQDEGSYERGFRRIATWVALCLTILALIVGLAMPLMFRFPLTNWMGRGLAILAALNGYAILHTPQLTYAASRRGAEKLGILIRRNSTVDRLAGITSLTMTRATGIYGGAYDFEECAGMPAEELAALAAKTGLKSDAPLLRAARAMAAPQDDRDVRDRVEEPGQGAAMLLRDGHMVTAGPLSLMTRQNAGNPFGDRGPNALYVSVDGRCVGVMAFRDVRRPGSETLRDALRHVGVSRVVLLTEQKAADARDTARALNITEYYGDCPPEAQAEKTRDLEAMQMEGDRLAFLGDGVRDAAAMEAADLGMVLVPTGATLPKRPEDVLLLSEDVTRAADAVKLGRDTMALMRLSLLLAIAEKLTLCVLAVLGLMPLWLAALLDALTRLALTGNSMRAFDPARFDPRILGRAAKGAGELLAEAAEETAKKE